MSRKRTSEVLELAKKADMILSSQVESGLNKIIYKEFNTTVSNLKTSTNVFYPYVVITDVGKEGMFKLDSTDTTSVNDDMYIIVDASNGRWKRTSDVVNTKLAYVITKTALIAYTQSTLAYYDGSVWEKKSGNVASNGGTAPGTIINVSTTVYWERKLKNGYIIPEYFGATESSTDVTVELQLMLDNSVNKMIDANNKSYIVTSLIIPSYTIFKNINLKTKGGSVNFVAPITINGLTVTKTSISLYNVAVDGNRINQTSLPTSGFAEDGGRSGFRIIGATNNLLLENCSANYCANDGISFVSSTSASSSDANHCFNNIKINNFTGNWNRRHGMSIDCLDGLEMNNTVFRFNGKDLNTTDAQSVGTRGARTLGFLYGNGVDFEDYGVGTGIQNINIQGINTTNNSYAGFVITSQVNPTATNFFTRKNIKIDNIVSSQGDDILVDSPATIDYSAVKIAGQVSTASLGYIYENIDITNAKLVGRFELRGVLGAKYNGSIKFSNGFFQALVNDSKDIFIDSIIKGTSKYTDLSNTLNYNEIYNSVANRFKLVTTAVDVDAPVGSGYLSSGSLIVANVRITNSSTILFSVGNAIGTQGFLRYSKNPGVGFTVYSSSSTDGSLLDWLIVN